MFRVDAPGYAVAPPAPTALGTEGYFTEGNAGIGQAATRVSADWLNMVQESLISLLTAAGISHSKSDYAQLWQSIIRGAAFVDTGPANTIQIATSFPIASGGNVPRFLVLINHTNTSRNVTLNINGGGAAGVLGPDGSNQLFVGDIVGGRYYEILYDGANWRVRAQPTPEAKQNSFGTTVDILGSSGSAPSGNYTVPAGCYLLQAVVIGGGGGTSGSAFASDGAIGGAGGGGVAIGPVVSVTPGASIAYVVGAGGAAVAYGATGGSGGTSSWATGGVATGGLGGSYVGVGGGGGGSFGMINLQGAPGAPFSGAPAGSSGGIGGGAPYLGSGGGSSGVAISAPGGWPGGGAGGPGSASAQAGKAGGNGAIFIFR